MLYYVDDCVYWCESEAIGIWYVDTLGNILHVNFLGYAYWFMSIRISQMNYHFISVNQTRYATSFVDNYLATDTVKIGTNFYNTTFPHDMIFTKDYTSLVMRKLRS